MYFGLGRKGIIMLIHKWCKLEHAIFNFSASWTLQHHQDRRSEKLNSLLQNFRLRTKIPQFFRASVPFKILRSWTPLKPILKVLKVQSRLFLGLILMMKIVMDEQQIFRNIKSFICLDLKIITRNEDVLESHETIKS